MAQSKRGKSARPKHEGCDVRLHAVGDTVKAEPVVRHLVNGLGDPWCGAELVPTLTVTSIPAEATCRRCFADRLKEMQRQARLRGDLWLLGEHERHDDYDSPDERMTLAQVDARPAQALAELSAGVRTRKARRATKAMPGSAEKQAVLAARVQRKESTAHPDDRQLDFLAAGLQVENSRNGATLVLGVIPLTGPRAEAAHQKRATRVDWEDLRERAPGVWELLSGEALLRRIEEQVGRSLHAAARALGAWPWGRQHCAIGG